MPCLVYFVKRIFTFIVTSTQEQALINQIITSGANVYTCNVKDAEIRRRGSPFSRDNLRAAEDRVPNIAYTL